MQKQVVQKLKVSFCPKKNFLKGSPSAKVAEPVTFILHYWNSVLLLCLFLLVPNHNSVALLSLQRLRFGKTGSNNIILSIHIPIIGICLFPDHSHMQCCSYNFAPVTGLRKRNLLKQLIWQCRIAYLSDYCLQPT